MVVGRTKVTSIVIGRRKVKSMVIGRTKVTSIVIGRTGGIVGGSTMPANITPPIVTDAVPVKNGSTDTDVAAKVADGAVSGALAVFVPGAKVAIAINVLLAETRAASPENIGATIVPVAERSGADAVRVEVDV